MKRVFWASTGYAVGLGSSVWVQRRVRRAVDRYTPEQLRQEMADRTRDLAGRARRTVIDLRDAAVEGHEAMRENERDLKAQFGGPESTRHRGNARAIGESRPRAEGARPRLN